MIERRQSYKRVERALAKSEQLWTTCESSVRMARIRTKGTEPELEVRRALTALGVRYRVNNRDLPGSPDIANRSKKFVVFVHGCYWHRHTGCVRATTPKTNAGFWQAKFIRNVERDASALIELHRMGYKTSVVWECELSKPSVVIRRLKAVASRAHHASKKENCCLRSSPQGVQHD